MAEATSVPDVLARARKTLSVVRHGLTLIDSTDEQERFVGICNVATYGRSVTFVLQNLRTVVGNFDAWYEPFLEEMKTDELFTYFRELRNEIEKEGAPEKNPGSGVAIANIDMEALQRNQPPNAEAFLIDMKGRPAWEIRLPDGTTEISYIDPTPSVETYQLDRWPDPPATHSGAPLPDYSTRTLARLYYESLAKIVAAATDHFDSS